MKLAVASDLHVHPTHRSHWDYASLENLRSDAEYLIVAGDIGEPSTLYPTMEILSKMYKRVVFVLGNHDHVNKPRSEVYELCVDIQADFPNVTWLENDYIDIEGKRFHGATLWYNAVPDWEFFDYMYIPNLDTWVRKANRESLDYFLENVNKGDVVITHHMPSYQCVPKQYKYSRGNQFFVCPEMEQVVEATLPSLHIFGHTHTAVDFNIRGTRVYCNPRGYRSENLNWKVKVIEI